MRTLIVTLFLAICGVVTLYAQGEDNSLKDVPARERVVFGGGFGLGFSNLQDYVMVSPAVGYMLTRRLMGGTSITYQYTNYKYVSPSVAVHAYGAAPFLRFLSYENLFLHTEYEYLNYQFPDQVGYDGQSFGSFLAGGGFVQPIGDKAAIYFMALYNFSYQTPTQNDFYPYSSPLIIRAGITLGRGFGLNY